jgi:GEVED domain/CARDB/Secretion system C-terminal sorting domain
MKINYLHMLFCSLLMLQTVSAQTLVINNVTGPTAARPGETITLTVTVSNTGTVSSVPTQLHYHQKRVDTYQTNPLCTQTATIPALAPNQTRVISYPLTLINPIYPPNAKYSGSGGLYTNYWFEDYYVMAANGIPSFYSDPKFIFNMAITFPSADISVAVQPNKTRLLNDETWNATYTVRNNSNIIAKQVFINLGGFANLGRNYYSGLYGVSNITNVAANTVIRTSGGESYSYGWEIFDLNPGESRQVTLQFSGVISLYQTGPQRTTLPYPFVNPFSNVIDATFESRPPLDITYNTTPMPDLAMGNLNITNPTVEQGKILYYKFDLANLGTGIAGNFNVKAYLSRQPYLAADAVQDGIVPTGNFAGGFTAFQVPAASTMRSPIGTGIYYLVLRVDEDNQVIESNESNNIIVSGPINVTPPVSNAPDLTLANLNLTNNTVQQGQILNYKFDLKNIGTVNIPGGFNVKGYISRDNILSSDDIQDGIVSTANFNAGSTALQVAGASTMRSPIGTGPYYLILKADADNQVVESNENNNIIASLPFQVTPFTNSCRYQDSLQLVRLYQATNSAAWINKWNLNTPIHTWHGVGLDVNGCVQKVELANNNLTGTVPNLNLPKLSLLFLNNNQLSGAISPFNLPDLDALALSNNFLTGSIPTMNLPNLKGLYLSNNQLTGSIPNFNCPKMVFIEITNNPLTGAIPNFNMPDLNGIIITFTQVTGPLPNFNLPKLTLLHLNNNQITGSIPNLSLPLLQNVFLQNNRFTGNIPTFNLPKANPLLLDNNQLTGSIPDFNVPANCFIRLNSNQLSGCIPISMKSHCNSGAEFLNNPGLANQDFTTFCSANVGACPTTSANYCASKGNLPWNEWIAGVQFSNVNNPNVKQGYADFTGATANVVRGSSYAFTLTQGYSWAGDPSNATAQWRVWIDYNKNNVFDANELAASGTRTTSTATIVIPSTATLGATRMRVSLKKTGAPTACEVFDNGEVEDYTVNIAASGGYEKIQKVDNQLVAHFNIFPNPAHQEAFLDLKDFENQRVELKVSDVAGKLIFNQTIEKASVSPHRLNTASLKNGTYFIEIQSVEKRITRQLSILN